MPVANWGIDDALHRGDDDDQVRLPDPTADKSLVRHILGLGGIGRATPYASTSEDKKCADVFAGKDGRVWYTNVARIQRIEGLRYISKAELLGVLRGRGMGDATWRSAQEVAQARAYVEHWAEHLVDFRGQGQANAAQLRAIIDQLFTKARP